MQPTVLNHNLTASPRAQHLIAGRYRTDTRIGKGRLGDIFTAVDEKFEKLGVEQRAAVQVVPESIVGNNKLFNKLNVGYAMLKAGAHPNIVEFFQFGRDGEFGFLAMELLEGASLRVLLDNAETLPPDEVKPMIRGIGEALDYLHAKGIVHGNLTTSNVFVGEDLEPRLLDVVPLGSDDGIFRGATMGGSFGRCTEQDDVFGLACLAYEMLTGKHPFNYCPPGEARLAGLEADRIASLTDDEWSALRLALSLELEERTASVKDFMQQFGILGTERLRPTAEPSEAYETYSHAAVEETPAIADTAPAPSFATATPAASVDPMTWNINDRPPLRSKRRVLHPVRTAFLGLLLAGLVAWTYYGQPEEVFVDAIGYVDETAALGLVNSGDEVVDVWTTEPDQPPLAESAAPVIDAPATEPAVTAETAMADSSEDIAEVEPAIVVEERVSVAEQSSEQPEIAETMTVDRADKVPVENKTESTPVAANTVIVDPFIAVSERDAAARIPLQHNTDSTKQLMWWTSDNTANGDRDFIAVRQRVMTDTSLNDGAVIHISLINDGVREPRESFFVNFGLRSIEQGSIELIATVRVDIIDDDLT